MFLFGIKSSKPHFFLLRFLLEYHSFALENKQIIYMIYIYLTVNSPESIISQRYHTRYFSWGKKKEKKSRFYSSELIDKINSCGFSIQCIFLNFFDFILFFCFNISHFLHFPFISHFYFTYFLFIMLMRLTHNNKYSHVTTRILVLTNKQWIIEELKSDSEIT